MFWERWGDWTNLVRKNRVLPLRVELWNGQHVNFSHGPPQVILRVPRASSLPYLLVPSLFDLAEAYVEEKIDLEGDLHAIIKVGNSLIPNHPRSAGLVISQVKNKLIKVIRNTRYYQDISRKAVQYHYDVSNQFYQLWLDKNMVYSCAYFENGDENLETAQLKKIDHLLNKIQLRAEHTLLDIGCGWGALVMRAAQKYGARCVGITLSKNQEELAKKRVFEAGLADRVEIRLQDYRNVQGNFDRITSVGMYEHVGLNNLNGYFSKIHSLLADDGVAINHGITTTIGDHTETRHGDFTRKYVFPLGELPHISTILKKMQESQLETLDVESLRRHYAKTCGIWADNFEANADQIKKLVGEKKYRIWRIYLAGSSYAFTHDWISIYQVLCGKAGQSPLNIPWSRHYMYDR